MTVPFPGNSAHNKKGDRLMSVIELPVKDPVAVGDTLPNGATVVAIWYDRSQEKFGDHRPQGVVLAWRGHEYATWLFMHDERGTLTVSGRYFYSGAAFMSAAKDFARRIAREGGVA
jgi:hypothetical protein